MKLFLYVALLLSSFLAHGQSSMTDGVLINADVMDRDLEKRVIRLTGNVQVVFSGQHLSCDKAEIDLKKQQIVAQGRVIMYNERAHVEGDKIVFNYKANTGHIFNGFVASGQVVFEGDVIQKIAEDRYLATNAKYTACETCPPGWSFTGKSIDAEIGGYARIRRPVFRVGGVPILILPSLIVPLKSARQSGFLVPSLEFSGRGGAALSESYFWAIDRSRDLTFTPKWYEKIGAKLHADYRYVLTESSRGRLQTAWINDRKFPEENQFSGTFDRWFAWYQHHLDLPSGYVHRADLKGVSDLRYPADFPDELPGHGDPALNNHISIANASDDRFASAQVDHYTNLLHQSPLAENEDAVHRAPEIKYSLKEKSVGDSGLFVGLDANFVNFTRERYNYDDLQGVPGGRRSPIGLGERNRIERDGEFDASTDLMRTGQRVDIQPRMTYPFQIWKTLDILPGVTFRETQYRFYPNEAALDSGFSQTAARRYIQTDLAVRTEITRVYGLDDPSGKRLKHSIEPEVGYSYIPWSRLPDHPFFGEFRGLQYSRQFEPISDSDLDVPTSGSVSNTGLQFDYHDRTYEKQIIDFGITQRLTRKVFLNGTPDYRTIALWRLWQSYDFNEAKAPTPHPWSSINSLLDLRFTHFDTYTTLSYNGYAKVTNVSSRVRGMITSRNFLQVGYTRNFILTEDYRVATDGETRNFSWGAGITMKYFEAVGQFDYNARELNLKEVQSFSYAVNVRPPGKCWLLKFEQRQVVNGEPDFKAAVSFDFGGENKHELF